MISEIWEWFKIYWLVILLGLIVFWGIFKEPIKKWWRRRKEEDIPLPMFPSQPFGLTTRLEEQQKTADQQVKRIAAEGQQVDKQETELDNYYNQQKIVLNQKRNNLSAHYNIWVTQYNMFNQMIENQRGIEKQLKGK